MQASAMNEVISFAEARELFEEIVNWLSSDCACGLSHSELEKMLQVNGNELLRRLLQGYLDKRTDDEVEGNCEGSDGSKRTHKRRQSRKLTTIFGTVTVSRIGYGGRKTTSLHPLDSELNLPTELYSHGVRQRVASEVANNGFNETVEIIKQTTGAQVPKRQVEELALASAQDFDDFYQHQQAQSKTLGIETGEILVISVDGKGVTMRQSDLRPNTQKRAPKSGRKLEKRLTKGEKRNSRANGNGRNCLHHRSLCSHTATDCQPRRVYPRKRDQTTSSSMQATVGKLS